MTVRMQKKKDAATLRLQKHVQEQTSYLVQQHSAEMLELLQAKQEEVKREIEKEIVSKLWADILQAERDISGTKFIQNAKLTLQLCTHINSVYL